MPAQFVLCAADIGGWITLLLLFVFTLLQQQRPCLFTGFGKVPFLALIQQQLLQLVAGTAPVFEGRALPGKGERIPR